MLIASLAALRGVTGDEGAVRAFIRERVAPLADSVRCDRLGNLISFKKGTAPGAGHVMLCAHMDEVGFIITDITEKGLLRFERVGAIDPRVALSKRVLVGADAVPGVVGAKAIHLQERGEAAKAIPFRKMLIDIGASSRDEAKGMVRVGDYASFDSECAPFGEGCLRGKALDDRAGCAMIIEALRERYPCDVTAVFAVQEEIGLRGAAPAAYGVRPDRCVVIEATTANDTVCAEDYEKVCSLGMGPAVSVMDRSVVCDPAMLRALLDAAKAHGIPCQIKRAVAGGTDAGAIRLTRGGIPCAVISTPCRYIHSPMGVIKYDDWANGLKLVQAYLNSNMEVTPCCAKP